MRRVILNRLIRLILLTVSISLASTAAVAGTEDHPFKMGVLDWQQLLQKAPQAEVAGKRLEKEFQIPKEKLDNKQKEFLTKRDKLQKDKDVMSANERAKKEKELAKMEQDLRRIDEELRSDYTTRHREEMDEFIRIVRECVDRMAKDKKIDLVIPQEATLFVSDRIDMTEEVLKALEKEPKK
jgi:outer membrane protein